MYSGEIFYNPRKPHLATLNKCNELVASCRHANKFLSWNVLLDSNTIQYHKHNTQYRIHDITISKYSYLYTDSNKCLNSTFLLALILKHTFKSVIGPVKGSKRANTRWISWRTMLQCLQFGTFEREYYREPLQSSLLIMINIA